MEVGIAGGGRVGERSGVRAELVARSANSFPAPRRVIAFPARSARFPFAKRSPSRAERDVPLRRATTSSREAKTRSRRGAGSFRLKRAPRSGCPVERSAVSRRAKREKPSIGKRTHQAAKREKWNAPRATGNRSSDRSTHFAPRLGSAPWTSLGTTTCLTLPLSSSSIRSPRDMKLKIILGVVAAIIIIVVIVSIVVSVKK